MISKIGHWILIACLFILWPCILLSQEEIIKKDQYMIREEDDSKLKILVHIWGEVSRPGEYIVSDGTDVLELISKAGGPTQYSNLGDIELTRGELGSLRLKSSSVAPDDPRDINRAGEKNRVIKINIKKYLKNQEYTMLPLLQPGDVVKVSRNRWFKFETFIKVLAEVAIIAQTWYYYTELR